VKLSILMPVYNEEVRLPEALKQALSVDYPCDVELVVVDDGSKDRTPEILAGLDDPRVRLVTHPRNRGKAAAIRTACDEATGEYMVILDADLEYDPRDIPRLLEPVLEGRAEVVYGNKTVTLAANMLYNCYLGDVETCFKLMPVDLYRSLDVRDKGFGIDPAVTGKLLRRGVRPYEVPISYRARTRAEGKKITWQDGVKALWILTRERVRRPPAGAGR